MAEHSSAKPWGWITMIDAAGCDPVAIGGPVIFHVFIDELLENLKMVRIGNLNIVWCDTNDPKKKGYSIYQLLQDSNVSAHFCPADRNAAYLDVFSCKEYDEARVEAVFRKYFRPTTFRMRTVERRAPHE